MESPEDFMRAFFSQRTLQIKSELENLRSFRQRFYSHECLWDSRKGSIERSEAEIILHISTSEKGVCVITGATDPWPGLRYHLQKTKDGWLIHGVDGQCALCRGQSGNTNCHCKGTGWLKEVDLLKRLKGGYPGAGS